MRFYLLVVGRSALAQMASAPRSCHRGNAIASEELAGRFLSVGYVLLPRREKRSWAAAGVGQTLWVARRLPGRTMQ